MKIRPIVSSDLKKCSEILIDAYGQEPHSETFISGNAFLYLENKFSICKDSAFLAENENSETVGFIMYSISIWANGKQATLEEIVVDPTFQHSGIGQELIKSGDEHLKKIDVYSVMLWTRTDERLLDFYKKQQFSVENDYVMMSKNI